MAKRATPKAARAKAAAKLKVYVTPIGFHDAYIAAPSQAAALRAWGASANLFARGVADVVSDPKLTAAPLARPGEVVKVARGSAAEHLAALPEAKPRATAAAGPADPPKPRPKPRPRPSRDRLAAAERALAELAAGQARARDALAAAQAKETARAEAARDRAKAAYRRALDAWDG